MGKTTIPQADGTTVIRYTHDDEPGYLTAGEAARLLIARGIEAIPAQQIVSLPRRKLAYGPWGVGIYGRKHEGRRRGPYGLLVFVSAEGERPSRLAMKVIVKLQELRGQQGFAHVGKFGAK